MKILLLVKRGLGNQLFQYTAGLFFARKYGATLEVVREPDRLAFSCGHPRPFLLSNFCISAPVREFTAWDRLMCSVALIKKPVAATARFASCTAVYRQRYHEDGTFLPELPIPLSNKTIYLQGDFQAYQYAQEVEQRIRAEFRLRNPAVGKSLDTLQQIRAVENPVSLHVRRGDYTAMHYSQRVLPLGYYTQAMQTIQQRVSKPTFFVFSDDIAFARENLPKGDRIQCNRIVFVDHNDEANPHEDMRLMSACCHNIIANSSLSWWGAWLNPNPAKLVCVPNNWQNPDPDFSYADLIPAGWSRIANDAS